VIYTLRWHWFSKEKNQSYKTKHLFTYYVLFLFLECKADEFKCNIGSKCIPKTQICDNIAQCPDQSDEWQCIQLDGLQLLAKYIYNDL